MTQIRQPAVSGLFYPSNPALLQAQIGKFLDNQRISGGIAPKAVIVPHAGYIYSGSTAASAFRAIRPAAERIRRVVLLGPSHRVLLTGIAAPDSGSFITPLGIVPIDQQAIDNLENIPFVCRTEQAHLEEHSLEVQIPFLQTILKPFKLIPLVVGEPTKEQVAEVLDLLWGGEETLIVISSDLSHYHDYDSARRIDAATCAAIESFNADAIGDDDACGRNPVKGLLHTAASRKMRIKTLALCNSGDTAGDKSRVVGYGAWGLWEQT